MAESSAKRIRLNSNETSIVRLWYMGQGAGNGPVNDVLPPTVFVVLIAVVGCESD